MKIENFAENRYDRLHKQVSENPFYQSQNGRTKNISLVCYTSKEIAMKINKKNTIINNNHEFKKVRRGFLNAQNCFTMADLRLLTQP
jgi:hypothetical protein